ncbi:phosphonate metabolism transcriptional regulator PhnF [Bradyrhizobium iriomotense]|uniref:Phosphonate metabolism transcriptional regulator PhnF n=1 Tax=Bradyrhizobium iriomotense TaxID=441950 RepID=A0ABQ6BB58_9BRAD|nr:phosphonate metabolism transcriptional regulator PhnF [Bradyrhizobium iriomotense]GLR91008.1 phosphonate metabolism transcriptional regulator PhnF [Bradyrhizobium iriomotense]
MGKAVVKENSSRVERAGITIWRQVSDALTEDIASGTFAAGERLPSSESLAARFGVNRHTVLKAIAQLEAEGYLRIERARGAYAVVNPIELRLGARSWFEQNLRDGNRTPSRKLIAMEKVRASLEIATALQIKPGSPVLFVTLLGEADGFPVNYNYNYFPTKRMPGLEEAFESIGKEPTEDFSFGKIFKSIGVKDFRRKTIRIRARPPSREEATHLKMPISAYILLTEVVQVDSKDTPLVYAETCYSAGRVSLLVDI